MRAYLQTSAGVQCATENMLADFSNSCLHKSACLFVCAEQFHRAKTFAAYEQRLTRRFVFWKLSPRDQETRAQHPASSYPANLCDNLIMAACLVRKTICDTFPSSRAFSMSRYSSDNIRFRIFQLSIGKYCVQKHFIILIFNFYVLGCVKSKISTFYNLYLWLSIRQIAGRKYNAL